MKQHTNEQLQHGRRARHQLLVVVIGSALGAGLGACSGSQKKKTTSSAPPSQDSTQTTATLAPAPTAPADRPRVHADSAIEAGRYLVTVGGCNDCHTPGFAESGGNVPESQWLTGNPVGFRGPWGTTYPANLRLSLKDMKAEDFVTIARHRKDKPPMPWPQLQGMSDQDLRAVYAYVRSLPVTGKPAPEYVPPSKEPAGPYFDFVPKNLPTATAAAPQD